MPRAKTQPPTKKKFGDKVLEREWEAAGKNCNEAARRLLKQEGDDCDDPSDKDFIKRLARMAKEVSRAVERMKEGSSIAHVKAVKDKSRNGRLPALDIIAINNLKDLAWRTAQQRLFIRPTEAECKNLIRQERAAMLVRRRKASRIDLLDMNLYPISAETEMSYINSIWPEDEEARHISGHRDKVKREIRNNISCCAVAGYVFSHTNPDCIETSDHFAVYRDSNGDIQIVRSAAGSGQMMRDSGFSVGFDGAKKKKRKRNKDKTGGDGSASTDANVKLPIHASFTMSKKVVALIAEIWDDQVVKPFDDGSVVKIFPIDATDPDDALSAECYTAHIVYGTPHEVVMHAMYKDIIIPKMVRIREKAKAMAEKLRGQVPFSGAVPSVSVGEKRTRSGVSASGAAAHSVNSVAEPNREVQDLNASSSAQPGVASLRSTSTSRRAAQAAQIEDDESDDEDEEREVYGPWVGMPEEFEIVLCLDGDSASITAILSSEKMATHRDGKHPDGRKSLVDIITLNQSRWGVVKFLKWAAGCTPMQSPNDVGKTHMLARRHLKGSKRVPVEAVPLAQCSLSMQRENARIYATSIKPARKSAFWRLISNLPNAVAEAFRPKTLAQSWNRAGFLPLSFIGILEKCSLWAGEETFSADQKRQIIDEIPRLYDVVASCGRAPDLKMEELWTFLPEVECATHTLEDLAVNRDRVALITHPNYFVGREEAAAAAHAANPLLKKKAKPPARRPAQPYRLYPLNDEQLVNNFPAWQVLAQLEMRGVKAGRTSAVQNLRELWKTNSNLPCLPAFASFAASAAAVVEPPFVARNVQELLVAQNAIPRTPPRAVIAASAPSTPQRPRTPPKKKKNKGTKKKNAADPFALDDVDESDIRYEAAEPLPLTSRTQPPLHLRVDSSAPVFFSPTTQATRRRQGLDWFNR
jgi:hypothetical protein